MKGPNLSLADAFQLQKQERYWKGKRREGAYKRARDFFAALRRENLTFTGLPKGTEETVKNSFEGTEGTIEEAVEETTEKAVEALFKRIKERRLKKDTARKKCANKK